MKLTRDKNGLAPCLAVLGTGSDVGKSIVVTALCRYFANQGIDVAPYKSQNMSNNSGVTPEGLEMGRAQIVQAEAARIAPHVDMNPILLKPTSEVGSQVVLLGHARENATAMAYHQQKGALFEEAKAALNRLRGRYDLIIMEGAGSCAEVNLMAHDIVNLPMADYAQAPVILVGDIHRGGIFAQLVGTLACLPPSMQPSISGFIINRFRGDIRLFKDGVDWIETTTGKPVYGVLPWYSHFRIESEDSVVIEAPKSVRFTPDDKPAIAILRIPHIANFTDFDALAAIEGLGIHYLEPPQSLAPFAAVIIPGSKNTRFDLDWLKKSGWQALLSEYVAQGGHLLGICGGYQMMGQIVNDPQGLEGPSGNTPGLNFLPIVTDLLAPKTTTLTQFSWENAKGMGYEIHMGQTRLSGGRSLISIRNRNGESVSDSDGCMAENGRCMGTYIHGFFDNRDITAQWLERIGIGDIPLPRRFGRAAKEAAYEQLCEHFTQHVDMAGITGLIMKDKES